MIIVMSMHLINLHFLTYLVLNAVRVELTLLLVQFYLFIYLFIYFFLLSIISFLPKAPQKCT